MKRIVSLGLAAALAFAAPVFAQQPAAAPAAPASAVKANPADVASVDAIVAALYDVISGPAGQPRDWNRMRSLFAPEGGLRAVAQRPDGSIVTRHMSVEDYISRNSPAFEKMAFFEREAARSSEQFGQIVHVFSTYESRHEPKGEPFQRGINSIQLYNDGQRWWIASVLWRGADDKLKLPERYLKNN
ncbi:hypothetical protein GCM10027321_10750 [Massilia terrae]|uniref:Nuclear transport factor 2 family protein n=1 Tax=Massilia terrae TaxID=1811224 RepID=A0ABT2D4P3_9BURK|nr:hypothetical protein [Massilia terrae]MCS0660308.1 hypothetical protein [Massilia terrae]